jgi:hypothetical protein
MKPIVRTDRASFRASAQDAPPSARIPIEVRVLVDDPFDAYRRVRGGGWAADTDAGRDGTETGDETDDRSQYGNGSGGAEHGSDDGTETGGFYLATTGGQSGWGYFGVDPTAHIEVTDADVREGTSSLADAIEAVFPGGTITGAPKPRTMEIIDELESTRRGPCTGSIGIFRFDERATLNILIRTLVRHRGHYSVRVGAGVVHDSDPDREYTETLDKARALTESVEAALERERDHDCDGDRDCEDGHDSDDDRDCDDRNREGSSDLASEGTP